MTRHDDAAAAADPADPLGSAAAEATRLVAALSDLVSGPAAEHFATGAAECQVCPLCRAIALLRDADPAAVSRVTDSVVAVVTGAAALAEPVLRSLVDTAISTAQAAAGDPSTGPASTDSSTASGSAAEEAP